MQNITLQVHKQKLTLIVIGVVLNVRVCWIFPLNFKSAKCFLISLTGLSLQLNHGSHIRLTRPRTPLASSHERFTFVISAAVLPTSSESLLYPLLELY